MRTIPPIVAFLDDVIEEVATSIAAWPPERGAEFLRAGDVVARGVVDVDGEATSTTYTRSQALIDELALIEATDGLTVCGNVHSHPMGVPELSRPDIDNVRRLIDHPDNGHVDWLVACVLTHRSPSAPHHLQLPLPEERQVDARDASMSAMVATRGPQGQILLRAARPLVIPFGHDVRAAAKRVDAEVREVGVTVTWGGRRLCAAWIDMVGGSVAVAVTSGYPAVPPVILHTEDGSNPVAGPLAWWDPATSADALGDTLANLAARHRPATDATSTKQAVAARQEPLSGSLAGSRVFLAGAGSGGSDLADTLARAGIGHLTVVDPDRVELPNVGRSTYTLADVGSFKVHALARHLKRISPRITVDRRPVALADLSHRDLTELVTSSSLAIGATDDPWAQGLLGHHAASARVPYIAAGVYAGGRGGEVVIVHPGYRFACYSCATGRGASLSSQREKDYGTGRFMGLVAELAIAPLIARVTTVAAEHAIGLLSGAEEAARRPVDRLAAEGRTLCIWG